MSNLRSALTHKFNFYQAGLEAAVESLQVAKKNKDYEQIHKDELAEHNYMSIIADLEDILEVQDDELRAELELCIEKYEAGIAFVSTAVKNFRNILKNFD